MAQQLGVILTPYGANSPYGWYAEIAQARGGNGSYLNSYPAGYPRTDRQFFEKGSPAFYYDTQLGSWQEPKTPIGIKIKAWWLRMFGPAPTAAAPAAAVALPRGDGMTPTDAELAINTQCYTPVHSGWINTRGQGFVPGTWRFNWNPAGDYGPPTSLSGARLGETTALDVLNAQQSHNDRMFKLAILSTTAVSLSALFTLWTRYKRLKADLHRKRR